MARFIFGMFVFPVLLGLGLLILFILNLFGVVSFQKTILFAVEQTFRVPKLVENYELGKKKDDFWRQKEEDFSFREARLKERETKLDEDQTAFETLKSRWEKDNPRVGAEGSKPAMIDAVKPAEAIKDASVQQFLTRLGRMKPQKAAAVLEKLPEVDVLQIIDGLDERQATKIMEYLSPELLARLTQERLAGSGKL
jgi:flagellar motility protein MotE (MotC chaperone)